MLHVGVCLNKANMLLISYISYEMAMLPKVLMLWRSFRWWLIMWA